MSRIKESEIAKFPDYIQKQIRDQLAVPSGNLEQNLGNGTQGKNAIKKLNKTPYIQCPVSIGIHSIRKRLADPGQLCDKWIIDCIVRACIIHEDSAEFVKGVNQTQEKGGQEETIIRLYES
jgi:hypothetical protein